MGTVFQRGSANTTAQSEPEAGSSEPIHATETGSFECPLCGFIEDGAKPHCCPACRIGVPVELAEAERKIASATATQILEWEPEALTRLERIPVGFMRTLTRCRIEHWARKVRSGQGDPGSDGNKIPKLEWRLPGIHDETSVESGRAPAYGAHPEFIRAKVVQEIESHASAMGKNQIDSEVLDRVVEKWGHSQSFHSHPRAEKDR